MTLENNDALIALENNGAPTYIGMHQNQNLFWNLGFEIVFVFGFEI